MGGNMRMVKCPICNGTNCEEQSDEIDIGVGIQRNVWGYICSNCGNIPVCYDCGAVGHETPHHKWCKSIPKESSPTSHDSTHSA